MRHTDKEKVECLESIVRDIVNNTNHIKTASRDQLQFVMDKFRVMALKYQEITHVD